LSVVLIASVVVGALSAAADGLDDMTAAYNDGCHEDALAQAEKAIAEYRKIIEDYPKLGEPKYSVSQLP